MNIDGMGEETVELFYNKGLIRNIADLYTLQISDMAELERWVRNRPGVLPMVFRLQPKFLSRGFSFRWELGL
jgi:NAD-dependent DNA ligase